MQDRSQRLSRRKFLASAATLTLATGISPAAGAKPPVPGEGCRARPGKPPVAGRKPLAVLCTVYRPLSHAHHLAARFLHGYARDGQLHVPGQYVRSLYVEQTPENDLSREAGKDFDVRVTRSLPDALVEGDRLAVDGVLLVAEHGNYPRNDKGQILYPRYEYFEQIVAAFRRTGRSVPVFVANHLSYSWTRAKKMVALAQELKFPLMAGSSLPVTWRRPELDLPIGAPVEDALIAGYGPVEVNGFHALEALQALVERRKGGEAGGRRVTCLTGRDVWKAGDEGRWSWDLLEAALSRSETAAPGDVRRNVGSTAVGTMPATPATAFLVEYRDGLRGTVLLLNGHVQVLHLRRYGPGGEQTGVVPVPDTGRPGARHFDCLAGSIETLFETGRPPAPVERTLLTTGVLAAAMESHQLRGTSVETPDLELRYPAAPESGFCRGGVTSSV